MMRGERLRQLHELLPRVEAQAADAQQSAAEATQNLRILRAAIAAERGQGRHLHAVGAASDPDARGWP